MIQLSDSDKDSEPQIQLKQLEPSMAPVLFGLVNSNRAYLRTYLPWVDKTNKVQDTSQFIKFTLDAFINYKNPTFAILFKSELVGCCSLHPVDFTHGHVASGYWIAEKFQGHGIVTKSVRLLLNYCFLDLKLNKVEIRCASENLKSFKIPERLGFHFDGILRENELVNGKRFDHRVYSLLKREWEKIT